MAKTKATKRIYQIAKELDVESKAIVAKCQAEEIPDITDHMSQVSVGLEATIREWFSGSGSATTAVETAEKVDLQKVKAKPRKKAKGAESETTGSDAAVAAPAAPAAPTAPVVLQPVAEPAAKPAVAAPASPVASPPPAAPASPVETPAAAAETSKKPQTVSQVAAQAQAAAMAAAKPAAKKAVEVKPAGEKVKPTAAVLKGPKVIRVEQAEADPMKRRGQRREPAGGPAAEQAPNFIKATAPRGGGGVKSKGGPGGAEREEEVGRSPRRKRAAGGKGRSADAELWTKGSRSEQDLIEREERLSHAVGFMRQRRRELRKAEGVAGAANQSAEGKVTVTEPVTIKALSSATGIKSADIIKFLFDKGIMATINATIDNNLAIEISLEHDVDLQITEAQTAEQEMIADQARTDRTDIRRRPPVVAILGHVDHGKTSLLDKIRSAQVAAGEAGGITQHIGAFRTTLTGEDGKDKTVVFLDTPGHQAFTNMRARGAVLADIVVLVVAADDGVMPQTAESINHAAAAKTPIVVALNKIDKPEATTGNIQKILGQLAEKGLNPVEWGGTTEVVRVSATQGAGITDLIEILDYQAELMDLKAGYDGAAAGQVIEAFLDPGRGPIARVLVQEGEMNLGDCIVMGRAFGKIRSMTDDRGKAIQVAGPATPVEISGIDEVPDAGDKVYEADTLKQAEEIAEHRREVERQKELAAKAKVTLDTFFEQTKAAQLKELRIVLKADVQGSVEVLRKALEEITHQEVKVRVLHAAVGGITESDVLLAEASTAVVIGFNVITSAAARAQSEQRGVDVRNYRIIYDIVEDVKRGIEGLLSPQKREEVLGHATVREVFKVSKVGTIAGCYVTDGVVRRNAHIRVTRDGIVIEHDRTLEQLKRFKDDAKEVRNGMECGMKIDGYDDIRAGDILECYLTTQFKPTLSGAPQAAHS